MALAALALTVIVFALTNLQPNLEKLARTQASTRMSDAEVASWLARNGYDRPMLIRYSEWLGVVPAWRGEDGTGGRCNTDPAPRFCGVLQGNWGWSTRFQGEVSAILGDRLAATGRLMFWVMLVMIPAALTLGILAGMREGSRIDRALSTVAITTTATPEYVSGVLLIALLASTQAGLSPLLTDLGLIDRPTLFLGNARSAATEPTFWNLALPVATIALAGMGYIARMTRASMAEVMAQPYIRTARLKGLPFRDIVLRHALRNALIAPFTVIMLQFPWLLNGVVITEVLFSYPGFGWTLVEAAGNNDIDLLLACSVVAVVLVLATQLISDLGYVWLNPRIRVR
nr:ABC transporter permease [Paracoccus sp. S-4012]